MNKNLSLFPHNINPLKEERVDVMSDREIKLKRKLIKLLRDDGKGHYHAMYAKRLEKYDLNIVPLGHEPSTAAISFEEGIIYINEGFLLDSKVAPGEKFPKTFYQLNVLMRHELSHDLMLHQIRMMKHITDIPWSHLRMSHSLHEILNILEDFEISNTRYSAEDKRTVRHMILAGRTISGLVTEDHQAAWLNLPLEVMYDKLVQEYSFDNQATPGNPNVGKNGPNLAHGMQTAISKGQFSKEPVDAQTIAEYRQKCTASLQAARHSKKAQLSSETEAILAAFTKLEPEIKVDPIKEDPRTPGTAAAKNMQMLTDLSSEIGEANIFKPVDVVHPLTGEVLVTLYTPEERRTAQNCIKILLGQTTYTQAYLKWYQKVQEAVQSGELAQTDIQEIQAYWAQQNGDANQ